MKKIDCFISNNVFYYYGIIFFFLKLRGKMFYVFELFWSYEVKCRDILLIMN